MSQYIEINGRRIGPSSPTYIIAEVSANHNQDFEEAARLVRAAKEAGADAVKLQTYTPETITLDVDNPYFRIGEGSLWAGRRLYDLYGEAYTPWEWHSGLQAIAQQLDLDFFSTPFDATAVEFLAKLELPVYKIASFELVDIPLIQQVARIGKPMILSTGMATLAEIDDAVRAAREAGATQIALLKCNSAYPAPPDEMNLRTMDHLSSAFGVPVGLSDHTLGVAVPVAAVALGACIIEKHFTLSRDVAGPDSAFSLEPHEFKAMVEAVRIAEQSLGEVRYQVTEHEVGSRLYRRSLFAVRDIKAGEAFTEENVRSIRPGHGLPPKYLSDILGRYAAAEIERGTPLQWNLIS